MPRINQIAIDRTAFWICSALLLGACGAPLGPIPGGKLQGELSPWPANWKHAENCENVLLETAPADPYSVTIWGVGIQDQFFVGASKRSNACLLYTSPSPRDVEESRMPSSA